MLNPITVGNFLSNYFNLSDCSKLMNELTENCSQILDSWADLVGLSSVELLDTIEYSLNNTVKFSDCCSYNSSYNEYSVRNLILSENISIPLAISDDEISKLSL